MKFIKPYFERQDDRGRFVGLLNSGLWEEVNYLQTRAGEIRGNHYHKDTVEAFFILSGSIEITTSRPNQVTEHFIVTTGDVFEIAPGEIHTFHCLTACEWLNFLSKKMDSLAPDIIPASSQ